MPAALDATNNVASIGNGIGNLVYLGPVLGATSAVEVIGGGITGLPSGHATLAMAVASSLAHSTKDHWSDVIGGGAIGFLVGRQLHYRGTKITPILGNGGFGGSLAF